ncbi:hypothetical protein AMECASPLE_007533 [Ameca splendens]|uniref:Uncharacterized protein n=1 Tax=Ameca splendens TaxID=208324 RepID=A0ABV0XCT0_9TELE
MSEMMKVEEDDHGGLSLEPPIPAASTSELEQKQDSKDLIRQMLVIKMVPADWSPSLEQQDSEPPHIKEEEEQLLISQEEERLTVKKEDEQKSKDEEKPQLSELHQIKTEDNRDTEAPINSSAEQMETEPDEEDCGGPEPKSSRDPICGSQQIFTVSSVKHKTEQIKPKRHLYEAWQLFCWTCAATTSVVPRLNDGILANTPPTGVYI